MGTLKDTMSGMAFLFEAGGRAVSGREVWLWAGACRTCCNVAAAVEDGRGQKGAMCRQLTSGWRPTFPITPSGWLCHFWAHSHCVCSPCKRRSAETRWLHWSKTWSSAFSGARRKTQSWERTHRVRSDKGSPRGYGRVDKWGPQSRLRQWGYKPSQLGYTTSQC